MIDRYDIRVKYILAVAPTLHQQAVDAGWWTDLISKESTIGKRSYIEMCALIITEITEAFDGYCDRTMDDKLPKRRQDEVELADAFIRMSDTAYGCGVDLGLALAAVGRDFYPFRKKSSFESRLMQIVNFISYSVEGHRKRDLPKRDINIAKAMIAVVALSEESAMDLVGAVRDKAAFNAVRPDHKLENRLQEGGKKE